ncbi:hypothetical protein GCM10009000_109330 [Halobacterium noricense]
MGVEGCRTTVHNWVQKADLQPLDGANPDHVAVNETVIQLNDERFWLYAAVDPATNRLLNVKLSPTRNQAITEMLFAELCEKHLVDDAVSRRFYTVAASNSPPTRPQLPIRKTR